VAAGASRSNAVKALLIGEDPVLSKAITHALRSRGHIVELALTGSSYQNKCGGDLYDTLLLNANAVSVSALDILRWLRRENINSPVMVLCPETGVEDKIRYLDAGADDYMVKPINVRELEARLRALVRRHGSTFVSKGEFGGVVLDTVTRSASFGGGTISLTRREFRLLELLTSRLDNVIPKERLMDQLFGYEEDVGPNAVELYISRIRQKLRETKLRIDTVRTVGYVAKVVNDHGKKSNLNSLCI
jgi:two-component system, OmpR family, response regulator TctD